MYWVNFEQAKQFFSTPLPEVNFKCLLPLSKRPIERSDVYEKLIGGHIAYPILVIPHSILILNRTFVAWDNIFLASHIITLAVLYFGFTPPTFIRDARKTLANEPTMPSVPGTWKTLPTTPLSSCSRKSLVKMFSQSCLLEKAGYPLSKRHNFSSFDKSIVTVSSGTLPIRK